MTLYTFQLTLLTSARVIANTRDEAEEKVRSALASARLHFDREADPVVLSPFEIEGDLDLVDVAEVDK